MLNKVQELIAEMLTIETEEITENASLRDDLDMSSLDLINLAVELEKEFDVSISNKAIVSAHTVSDVLSLLEKEKFTV